MHTVELLPDAELTDGVRELWARLRDAGLPSLGSHPHPTNRPHLTVLTAAALDGLTLMPLPIAATLGTPEFLGRALVRPVTSTDELLTLHGLAWSSLAEVQPWPPPEEFVPHVSLALRVPPDKREAALELLASVPPATGHFVAARTYDSETRSVAPL